MKKTSLTQLICSIFLTPVFAVGLIVFILWISLHPHRPTFQIQEFSVSGLGQTNGFENASVSFNITARNSNRRFWIDYGSMNASVFYKDQHVGTAPLLDSLNQAPKNTSALSGSMSMSAANVEFGNNGTQEGVVFGLMLRSIIHFRKCVWDRRHHHMQVNCDAGVGGDGLILPSFRDKRCVVHFSWFNST